MLWSGHSTPRFWPKRSKTICPWIGMFITPSLFIAEFNDQKLETTQTPINRWMDKHIVAYCHNKNELSIDISITWMNLKIIILSERSQTQKKKCIVFIQNSRTCDLIYSDRKQISGYDGGIQRGVGGRDYKGAWGNLVGWWIGSLFLLCW